MMRNFQRLATLLIATPLFACANINPTDNYPVISKTFGPNAPADVGEAIAIKADRRIVIVMVKPTKNEKSDGEWGKFCAEPPPDVANEISHWLTAKISAQNENSPKMSAEETRTEIQKIQALFSRTQGAQMFRDGLYNICQLYANNAIAPKDVEPLFKHLLDTTSRTAMAEIASKQAESK